MGLRWGARARSARGEPLPLSSSADPGRRAGGVKWARRWPLPLRLTSLRLTAEPIADPTIEPVWLGFGVGFGVGFGAGFGFGFGFGFGVRVRVRVRVRPGPASSAGWCAGLRARPVVRSDAQCVSA